MRNRENYLSSHLTLELVKTHISPPKMWIYDFKSSAAVVVTRDRAFFTSPTLICRCYQWVWASGTFDHKIYSPSWKMQEYLSWSITPVRLDPRWSDRVHNTPCVWQPRIVEWLKLIQRRCSVITELPVSSPWSFRVNQSQSLISFWRCTEGPTKRDRQYRGEDRQSHVFTPAFQFH